MTLRTAASQPSLSITNSLGDAIQPSHPLSFPSPPTFNFSQHQGLFHWVSSSHHMARVLEFHFQHQSFQWTYSEPISFRIGWFDLLVVQWTLKSLLQHHSSKASTIRCSAIFMVQLSHPYKITGKAIIFKRWTFVGKVMSRLFNILSRLVIAFLSRSKHPSWLQSPSAVILESKKIKSVTVSIVSPSMCHLHIWGYWYFSRQSWLQLLHSPV